jgi:malonyl-CoA O-methyltransferase
VNEFIDLHDVGDALTRAGFGDPVLDVDRHVAHYDDVLGLMRDLKALGAHNVSAGRPRGLTGRGTHAALAAAYETHRRGGKLPASYEVIYGNAWGTAPRSGQVPGAAPGVDAVIPVSQIGRRDPSSH